jgi:hypothetical protein
MGTGVSGVIVMPSASVWAIRAKILLTGPVCGAKQMDNRRSLTQEHITLMQTPHVLLLPEQRFLQLFG